MLCSPQYFVVCEACGGPQRLNSALALFVAELSADFKVKNGSSSPAEKIWCERGHQFRGSSRHYCNDWCGTAKHAAHRIQRFPVVRTEFIQPDYDGQYVTPPSQ